MTPRRVIFSPAARRDLVKIYDWIADAGSGPNAVAFVQRIERYCLGFALAPEHGRLVKAFGPNMRAVGFNRQATIVFKVAPDAVKIIRVYRAGLDWTAGLPHDD